MHVFQSYPGGGSAICRIESISLLNCTSSALKSSVPDPDPVADSGGEYGFDNVDTADSLGATAWYLLFARASRRLADIGGAAPGGRDEEDTVSTGDAPAAPPTGKRVCAPPSDCSGIQ
jgi:hypothetical protein